MKEDCTERRQEMKNTRFKNVKPCKEFVDLTKQWESEGFTVLMNVMEGYYLSEDSAIESLINDIKKEYPEYKPLETVTDIHGNRIYVAAKCKLKNKKVTDIINK